MSIPMISVPTVQWGLRRVRWVVSRHYRTMLGSRVTAVAKVLDIVWHCEHVTSDCDHAYDGASTSTLGLIDLEVEGST